MDVTTHLLLSSPFFAPHYVVCCPHAMCCPRSHQGCIAGLKMVQWLVTMGINSIINVIPCKCNEYQPKQRSSIKESEYD